MRFTTWITLIAFAISSVPVYAGDDEKDKDQNQNNSSLQVTVPILGGIAILAAALVAGLRGQGAGGSGQVPIAKTTLENGSEVTYTETHTPQEEDAHVAAIKVIAKNENIAAAFDVDGNEKTERVIQAILQEKPETRIQWFRRKLIDNGGKKPFYGTATIRFLVNGAWQMIVLTQAMHTPYPAVPDALIVALTAAAVSSSFQLKGYAYIKWLNRSDGRIAKLIHFSENTPEGRIAIEKWKKDPRNQTALQEIAQQHGPAADSEIALCVPVDVKTPEGRAAVERWKMDPRNKAQLDELGKSSGVFKYTSTEILVGLLITAAHIAAGHPPTGSLVANVGTFLMEVGGAILSQGVWDVTENKLLEVLKKEAMDDPSIPKVRNEKGELEPAYIKYAGRQWRPEIFVQTTALIASVASYVIFTAGVTGAWYLMFPTIGIMYFTGNIMWKRAYNENWVQSMLRALRELRKKKKAKANCEKYLVDPIAEEPAA